MPMQKNFFNYKKKASTFLIFSILWALLLSLLAVQPEELISPFTPFSFMSTAAHAIMYFILTWLLCVHYRFRKTHFTKLFIFSVILASSWGIINEGLQFFEPSRVPDWQDIFTNSAGALLAGLAFVIWRKVNFQ